MCMEKCYICWEHGVGAALMAVRPRGHAQEAACHGQTQQGGMVDLSTAEAAQGFESVRVYGK